MPALPRRNYWLLLSAILMSACSHLNIQETARPLSDAPLPEYWQLMGKLGVRSAAGNGSLTINWQQNINDYVILTQAPLGQGTTQLKGDHQRITILRANQTPITSLAPEHLIEEIFGWHLPLDGLKHWVRGEPQPNEKIDHKAYDAAGNLIELAQSGWELSLSRYQPMAQWVLPRRIRATQGDTRLTLIIREWVLE